MAIKQLLLHTEMLPRSRTLHAGHFRKDSKIVYAKARNNPERSVLDPACVNESTIEIYRRMYSVSYANVQSLKFIETCSNGSNIFVKRGTSL